MNLNLKGLSEEQKQRAKRIAGEILVEEINSSLDRSTSPVKGGKYKRKKKDGTDSELFEFGDMRASISFEEQQDDSVTVGIFENAVQVERLKAFNHNNGDTLPQRRFIAAPNQVFKKGIMDRVNNAINEIRDEPDETQSIVDDILGDL
ncbi:MAG: hypothetical protein HRT70_01335 [Flavobacteriaceae bacterium]|nr:hypothetical protein [Flavobacteriaceae bacterium]